MYKLQMGRFPTIVAVGSTVVDGRLHWPSHGWEWARELASWAMDSVSGGPTKAEMCP